ncbi:MAG TPA: dipeptidase PepE [Thermoanaerobaculia bacterium]|nr:dipeptidase PepE [Thermoanaerobaculia bacterium]
MARRLLLISTSTTHGTGYLDHCADQIQDLLGNLRRVLFVPYALYDHDAYAEKARERYARMGYELTSVHEADDPAAAVRGADALFIGGGNTFRLLTRLYEKDLLEPIRRRVAAGMPYVGTSAGSNVACVTIRTTNDMPIVQPPSFDALDLVPFNLNPHYLDPDPASTHMGETREERLRQFLEENDKVVVGLCEGAMLRIEGSSVRLLGSAGARIFRRGHEPQERRPGDALDFLLAGAA